MTSRIVVFAVGVAGCGDCSDVGKPAEYGTPDAATGRDVGDSEAGGWDIDDSQDGGTVADAEIDVRVRENRRPWSADMSYPDVTDAPAPLGTVCDYSDYDCDRESNELCVGRACYQACDDTMCEEGQRCRQTETGQECFEPWECSPYSGRGEVLNGACRIHWPSCDGVPYSLSCKGLGPLEPDYSGPVECTCAEDGEPVTTFTWVGYPCSGFNNDRGLYSFLNSVCGWSLPTPRIE
jgi:hypothetical protein